MSIFGVVMGLPVAIIVLIATFSIFPNMIADFSNGFGLFGSATSGVDCSLPAGTNATASDAAWTEACKSLNATTTAIPIVLTLAVIIGAILMVTRFIAGDDDYSSSSSTTSDAPTLPAGYKPTVTRAPEAKKIQAVQRRKKQGLRWFLH